MAKLNTANVSLFVSAMLFLTFFFTFLLGRYWSVIKKSTENEFKLYENATSGIEFLFFFLIINITLCSIFYFFNEE